MTTNPQKRISLFADSLALPRAKEWGEVAFENTYPYLLEDALRKNPEFSDFIFINRAQRFRTVLKTAEELIDFVVLPSADYVIIHCGVVDCAPRIFTASQRDSLSRLPGVIRKPIIKFSGFLRRWLISYVTKDKHYVSITDFRESLDRILSVKEVNREFIILNIIVPSDDLERRSPGYIESARKYNIEIKNAADRHGAVFVDLNSYIQSNGGHEALTVDDMHVNDLGHKFISMMLLEIIQSK